MQRVPGPLLGRTGVPHMMQRPDCGDLRRGLQGGVLSRDGPDARSRPAGCGAGEDGAGLRDADGAC